MAGLWLPGARHDPGRSAGYPRGRVQMLWLKHHDTAGTNSYEVCRWGRPGYAAGLCTWLLPKIGTAWQFCEIDSLCFDSGDWNQWGPSIEVERFQGEGLTPDQTFWLGRIGVFAGEHGIPNVQYRGPQFGAQGFHGHVNHRDIAHNPDGLSPAEWDAVVATSVPEPETITGEEEDTMLIIKRGTNEAAIICASHRPRKIASVNDYQRGTFVTLEPDAWDQYWADALKLYNAAIA